LSSLVYDTQAISSSFSSRWLAMTGLFAKVIALAEEGVLSAAPQVNRTVSRILLQECGYRNTRGLGKLEKAEELGPGAYTSQLRMLR
jgi:hypothetical protein